MGLMGRSEGVWAAGKQEERVDLGCLAKAPLATGAAEHMTGGKYKVSCAVSVTHTPGLKDSVKTRVSRSSRIISV